MTETPDTQLNPGSHDGAGAADNDKPYLFGQRPTSRDLWPFSLHDLTRLTILRSKVQAGLAGGGDIGPDVPAGAES